MFLYSDATWVFDQSERAQGPIYILKCNIQYITYISIYHTSE